VFRRSVAISAQRSRDFAKITAGCAYVSHTHSLLLTVHTLVMYVVTSCLITAQFLCCGHLIMFQCVFFDCIVMSCTGAKFSKLLRKIFGRLFSKDRMQIFETFLETSYEDFGKYIGNL